MAICRKCLAVTIGALLALIQFMLAPSVQSAETDEFHPHTLGVFLGGTDESGGSTEFTYGLEYAFRFNDRVGVGLVYESTDEGHDGEGTTVALGAVYYSPYPGWRLGAGIGQEEIDGDHGHTETLYRVGVAYHFHIGRFGLAPIVNVDHVDGDEAVVFGLALTVSL